MRLFLAIIIAIFAMCQQRASGQGFVTVEGNRFMLGGDSYHYLGANYWYGMQLAAAGPSGERERLRAELDQLQALGVTNLRIMGSSEGPEGSPWSVQPSLQPRPGEYREEVWDGLDYLLAEMAKRDMKAVVCLNNFWPWSGGMAQYYHWFRPHKPIPYPPPAEGGSWLSYMLYSARFYRCRPARQAYEQHLRQLLARSNRYTGLPYVQDPTIMAWQLANEPRGMLHPWRYRAWIRKSARLIKSIDPNHLVSLGSEGNTSTPTGNHFRRDHRYADIDYTTLHIWVQNWGWYDPLQAEKTYPTAIAKARNYLDSHLQQAERLRKPLVLEEFGLARDQGSYEPSAPTHWRDRYYGDLFAYAHEKAAAGSALAGCNFWAWSGLGRPREAGGLWQAGDPLIGDPPHEHQGWYGVYSDDASTLSIIRHYAAAMARVGGSTGSGG
jgi:mannan endo-1,4-beta-mannosidase